MKTLVAPFLLTTTTTGPPAQVSPLPPAQQSGGLRMLEAPARRSTGINCDVGRDLTAPQLANLLCAGLGVSRADGRRTVPSAGNTQEIELDELLKTGAYLYDAPKHALGQVTSPSPRRRARRRRA